MAAIRLEGAQRVMPGVRHSSEHETGKDRAHPIATEGGTPAGEGGVIEDLGDENADTKREESSDRRVELLTGQANEETNNLPRGQAKHRYDRKGIHRCVTSFVWDF